MQKQGTIQRWDATRGFGFIRSPQTPADIFFHIKDYRGAAAPCAGDSVQFEEITVGGKGPRAMAVRPASGALRKAAPPQPQPQPQPAQRAARRPRAAQAQPRPLLLALAAVWLALLVWGVWAQRLPLWTLGAAAGLNLLTYGAYWNDKRAAQAGQWRTKEDSLHLFSLLGGWPAAGLAQATLRHKSAKPAFQATYWVTVLAHGAALLVWLFWLQP